jgi:hypothetical protein
LTDQGLRRVLVEKTPDRTEHELPVFARSHNALIIAQWISAIDKIARKPTGRKKPTPEQRALRQRLGEACWRGMTEGGHLPGVNGGEREFLENLWWFKIHPYGNGTEEPRSQSGRKPSPPPRTEGRWYGVFAGDCKPDQADGTEIARRIEAHLYEGEYRFRTEQPVKRRGKIEARAQSISSSVLGALKVHEAQPSAWTDDDIARYRKEGDPAQQIFETARTLEADAKNYKRITHADAAETLFQHWPKVFRLPETGAPMNVAEAREAHPGLFALHTELKQSYSRLLKRTRRDTRDHRKKNAGGRKLSALLPRNLEEALQRAKTQNTNADLARLVRLGKVIHYTASEGSADRPAAMRDSWPTDPGGSRFWGSDGQAEIKRAEAFVRVWRHALVQAGMTLKDWVSMREPFGSDILGGANQLAEALRPDRFVQDHFDRKLLLLFGSRAPLFGLATTEARLEMLGGLISGTAQLRNAVFHFKGRGQLLDHLAGLPARFSASVSAMAQRLWHSDKVDRAGRLNAVLRGAHVEQFLTQEQLAQVFAALPQATIAGLPLPRFSRILVRAENAWEKDTAIRLPKPANRRALEAPARLCQYTVLKLLYERVFRSWLAERDATTISDWIDRAVARATEAAKALNAGGDEIGRKVIAARAAELPKPPAGGDIRSFFFDLSAASASEMRVQRGYDSDADNAREQAEYIEHLLCDVVILAFSAFLSEQGFVWILDLPPQQPLPERPSSTLDLLVTAKPDQPAEDWQVSLYLILHLLPVETVGRLLHQLFKWEITAGRDSGLSADDKTHLHQLIAVMTLYLDMHDAKFEGDAALVGCEAFRELFASDRGFERVFPRDWSAEADRRLPRRGLREIMRFGHLPLLRVLSRGRTIDDPIIDRVFALEAAAAGAPSQIAVLQKEREDLHDSWVKAKHLSAADLRKYCETLARVSEHRRESGFVNLVDHVRAHRTVLAALGRLVDYAGLFERDLYFVTLAVMYREGLHPTAVFNGRSLELLLNGQIIFALRELSRGAPQIAAKILPVLAEYFEEVWARNNACTGIRNELAHLNMLQGSDPAPALTHWVNQARRLMAYDRKLKNAVSKSVIELVAREGIDLRWGMQIDGQTHNLTGAQLSSRSATHLGKTSLTLVGRDRPVALTETLHSAAYVAMIAEAFGGRVQRQFSIVENLPNIDWQASTERRPRGHVRQGNQPRPHRGRPNWRQEPRRP